MSNFIPAILHFQNKGLLGNGGYGGVYLAYDPQLHRDIAIKAVPVTNFPNPTEFFQEAQKLYLTRHHNVVPIHFAGQNNMYVFLSMPYCRNGSLEGMLVKGFLSTRSIIRYSLQFLSGLNNIHAKGLIHFDIKTANILISDSDQALISDFGLAQYISKFGFSEQPAATYLFAPPEYYIQTIHDFRYDIYQAGLAIYQMCNGIRNLEKQYLRFVVNNQVDKATLSQALSAGTYPDRSFFLPHIPIPMRKVIKKALSVDPEDRYDSVISMLNDLSKIEDANDWIYSVDSAGVESWVKPDYMVTASLVGETWNIVAIKRAKNISAFSRKGITLSEKKTHLYKCFNTNW